ncbi:antibiotic biosynthesis monooxygenase [bacterium]|nr:antibiotic biosynthesis monooxygenase [bacterium]
MIRVIIERHIKEGKKGEIIPVFNEMRAKAVHRQGYISSEILSDIEDDSIILVISAWRNLTDWRIWEESDQRKNICQQIKLRFLTEEPKVRICEPTATEESRK